MNPLTKPILAAALGLALVGCSANDYGPKQGFGTLAGAAAGGLLGAQVGGGSGRLVTTAIGTLAGAMVGNSIGTSLDRADALHAQRARDHALEHAPIGKSTVWRNPDSGHSGSFTPMRTYRDNGAYCREYQQTVIIGGHAEDAYGQACRQPDGSWLIS